MGQFAKGYDPKRGDQVRAGKARGFKGMMTEALVQALKREIKDADGKPTKRMNMIADTLAAKASEGDVAAIREVFDRTDGKAAQMLMGDPDNPLAFMFDVTLVRPN